MKKLLLFSALGFVLLTFPAAWMIWAAQTPYQPAEAVDVMIPKGTSTIGIGKRLAEAGVIDSKLVFRVATRFRGVEQALKSGLYRFEEAASVNRVIDRLVAGDVMRFQITVPEGLRNDEIVALLAQKSGMAIEEWQGSIEKLLPAGSEGFLLPETYQYNRPLDTLELLATMRLAQKKVLVSLSSDSVEQDKIRIAASIIEKETRLDAERPIVSAVIRNRLQKGMPLQMDPTVIYGIWKTTGSFSGNIRKRDLSTDTPWNTYTRKGLPPTAIGNPGAASLYAAAHPADVDYPYFVADGTGGHKFAATLAEHAANVKAWVQLERKQSKNGQSVQKPSVQKQVGQGQGGGH